ncbi:MAG: outer membrane lipoprotein LolB [Betaproteobacteria bacterium]|nr:outer membrane lipoprotein LolB [Betaproteobacteria bacterium]
MRSFCVAVVALLLAACATPGFILPQHGTEFELAGRIAVTYRDDAGSGNIAWRHGARSDELLLTTPLGQGIARLARADGEITLTTQDGREFRAADAESLTEQALGFRLPLLGLADWVRGRAASQPAPEPVRERRDAAGRLAELEQSGWKIRYLEYADALPSRLTLTFSGLELRLAISEWK